MRFWPRTSGSTKTDPATVKLNVIHVYEKKPPSGEPAVEWFLLTSLPIATPEDIAFVVDGYRARWVIEEFFKALKTGCPYETRQLESAESLLTRSPYSPPSPGDSCSCDISHAATKRHQPPRRSRPSS